jgi:hypothetical protein
MAGNESTHIESILVERRKFEPPAQFSKQAAVKSVAEYEALYQRAAEDPEGFSRGSSRSGRCSNGNFRSRSGLSAGS